MVHQQPEVHVMSDMPFSRTWRGIGGLLVCLGLVAACEPTVKVAAPDKPIVINLNVKIEHEVRVKVERDVDALLKADDLLQEDQELF